jgi:hypothetical protein
LVGIAEERIKSLVAPVKTVKLHPNDTEVSIGIETDSMESE